MIALKLKNNHLVKLFTNHAVIKIIEHVFAEMEVQILGADVSYTAFKFTI